MNNKDIGIRNIIIAVISALGIVICSSLKIDSYLSNIIIPFFIFLISNIILVKNNKNMDINAYLLLVPIFLVLISDLVISIDSANKALNIIVLPILISIFFFKLLNKNYKFSFTNILLIFKIFPDNVIENFDYFKKIISNMKNKKLLSVLIGIGVSIPIVVVLLGLLTSADLYFSEFMNNILSIFSFDIDKIIKFGIFFVFFFCTGINIINSKDLKMYENKEFNIDGIIVTTILSIVNFVFVLFIVSEISKLTNNFLSLPVEYTFSSYAREGFFQLLFVTIINFSIIMFFLYKTKLVKENKFIKYLTLSLIFFSIILIFNSYYRMFLYIGAYKFTILRLQVILFLAMELIIFGLLVKRIVSTLKNESLKYFIIMVTFYIVNLYLCNEYIIDMINKLF